MRRVASCFPAKSLPLYDQFQYVTNITLILPFQSFTFLCFAKKTFYSPCSAIAILRTTYYNQIVAERVLAFKEVSSHDTMHSKLFIRVLLSLLVTPSAHSSWMTCRCVWSYIIFSEGRVQHEQHQNNSSQVCKRVFRSFCIDGGDDWVCLVTPPPRNPSGLGSQVTPVVVSTLPKHTTASHRGGVLPCSQE